MRYRALWLGLGWAFVVLVIYLSLNTDPIDAGRVEGVKVGHFIAYAWLMLWFSQIYRSMTARAALAMGFTFMGVALEYAQGMTEYRTFAYSDMGDNALGVGTGFALGWTALGNILAAVETKVGKIRFRGAA